MSKSVYQTAIINTLENNVEPMTIRQIMKHKDISRTKNTYVIAAVKRLIEINKVRISYISYNNNKESRSLWMDTLIEIV